VQGNAAPGPAGPLIAPASGEECVWYFTGCGSTTTTASEPRSFDTVWVDGQEPFAVRDGTGTLLVDSGLLGASLAGSPHCCVVTGPGRASPGRT
jgi:hypothetical protein